MTNPDQIWAEALRTLERGKPFVLATVVNVRGSTPREVGAKMIVRDDGQFGHDQVHDLAREDPVHRAPVGEHRHLIRRDAEAQQKTVLAHLGNRWRNAFAESGEIELAAALVDLHGVAAAHGNVRLCFPLEMREFTVGTNTALRVAGDMK